MAKDLPSSKSLRAGLRAAGKPDRWDMEKRPVKAGYEPGYVQMYCVEDSAWQRVRLSMKSKDTTDKLQMLKDWWSGQFYRASLYQGRNAHLREAALKWATEVQVGNYLGALRRGGQLNDENMIRKAR